MENSPPRKLPGHWQRVIDALVQRCGSQAAASREIGVSLRQLIRWLNGASRPREGNIQKIEEACDRLGIKATDLLGPRAASFALPVTRPAIASVSFRSLGGRRPSRRPYSSPGYCTYLVTVKGQGFGAAPHGVPFVGVTDRFRIANHAQLGFAEYGYVGDHKKLSYQRWSDAEIVVRGFNARAGDSAVIALWDERGRGATWGGNVPPCARGAPVVKSLTFQGYGRNLKMTVKGSGFGRPPRRMPFRGNLDHFIFADFRGHSDAGSALFGAGFTGFDRHAPHRVLLRYRSWTDHRIEIDGFSGRYGENQATVQTGDPVAIVIWNSDAKGPDGPQTAWGGTIRAGQPRR